MSKPIVLLDLDNTILDIPAVKKQMGIVIEDNYGSGTSEKFWQIYDQVREDVGYVNVKEIAMRFAKAVNSVNLASAIAVFLEVHFEDYLLPGAKELIEFLGTNTDLIVFTKGDEMFQSEKVKRLGLDKVAKEVIISPIKKDLFVEVSRKYSGMIIVVDDNPEILEKAKEAMPNCMRIWVKFGKYASTVKTLNAELETEDLVKVKEFIGKLTAKS